MLSVADKTGARKEITRQYITCEYNNVKNHKKTIAWVKDDKGVTVLH
jgi:hypothetical protein